ncbi:MAG TPA: hypothetical protein PK280_20465 [Planctomycetota bacterium]|nr:hypothetical protein [Planctomycetota bacterium]
MRTTVIILACTMFCAALAPAGEAGGAAAQGGVELWTAPTMDTVQAGDSPRSPGGVGTIRIIGARNGTFSGRAVLKSVGPGPVRGLKAAVSDLAEAGGKGRIPCAAVQVRWADWASPAVSWAGGPNHKRILRFDRLLEAFPAEMAPANPYVGERQIGPLVMAPVWVTVRVPEGAAGGEYKGILTIEGQAAAPFKFSVPVELQVSDWRLPDPRDFVFRTHLYQSPDTVAQYYKVPLWSDRHWELMGRSLEALAQLGNRVCLLPLVEKGMAINNSQSMVRWVKKADGSYEQDFSIMEKYLDLYASKCGKPGLLMLFAWESSDFGPKGQGGGMKMPAPPLLGVTVVDPATGKTETLRQPEYGTKENEAFWRPVFTELRRRLEKRGWFDVAAMANARYCAGPYPEHITVFRRLWPDGKWVQCAHAPAEFFKGATAEDRMPVFCNEWVWGSGSLYDPDSTKKARQPVYPRWGLSGGKPIAITNPRSGNGVAPGGIGIHDDSWLALYRLLPEGAVQGGVHGLGRLGGDFWPLPGNKDGKFVTLCEEYGGCSMTENVLAMVSPGPDGAVFGERAEAFREGVQVAEAIIRLQQAVDGGKGGGDFAKRAAALLDERARRYLKCDFRGGNPRHPALEAAGWQELDARLFALCAEAAGGR